MGNEKENVYMICYGLYALNLLDKPDVKLGKKSYHSFYPGKSEHDAKTAFEMDKPSLKRKLKKVLKRYRIDNQVLELESIQKVEMPSYELILKKIK